VVICNVGVAELMLILNARPAVCDDELESFTDTLNEKFPDWVGVPEIAPVLLSVKPEGRLAEETDQPSGAVPPVALSCAV
jgi:hypothetical protein